MEADALLLIVAILEDCLLSDLLALTHELGMDAIVEVHTAEEMERALRVGSDCIGINNRDLRTFQTRLETTAELARLAPPDSLIAALSGISTREDVEEMARAGARAVLVGESLMRQPDVAEAARALCGVPIRSDLSRSAK
jgi:indole-3-glycerol phosphate synthase